MNLKLWGALALKSFSDQVAKALQQQGISMSPKQNYDLGLAQLHGAPHSQQEDQEILAESLKSKFPVVYLIHRPDEILENQKLMQKLEPLQNQFIFLGDLVLQLPFWKRRAYQCHVIPHPFTNQSLPPTQEKPIVGTFTSWGEMRNPAHYLELVHELRAYNQFEFKIGGPGLEDLKTSSDVTIAKDFFVPHFNVQLYHLHGKKRIGESSGSLHRGVCIPVIFEANGTERLEDLVCIKIDADEELSKIDFAKAAFEIHQLAETNLHKSLKQNLQRALMNSSDAFALALIKCVGRNHRIEF